MLCNVLYQTQAAAAENQYNFNRINLNNQFIANKSSNEILYHMFDMMDNVCHRELGKWHLFVDLDAPSSHPALH